ncbi:hypothetical protein Gotur_026462 [Gossypium turneri]
MSMRTVRLGNTSEHEALEKSLSDSQREKGELMDRVTELERSLRQCLEAIEGRNNEQVHYFRNQVRIRDHIMEEAVVQIREVVDHIQTLAVQADMLSVKYELELDRGQELALLLRKIRILSNRSKLYL